MKKNRNLIKYFGSKNKIRHNRSLISESLIDSCISRNEYIIHNVLRQYSEVKEERRNPKISEYNPLLWLK